MSDVKIPHSVVVAIENRALAFHYTAMSKLAEIQDREVLVNTLRSAAARFRADLTTPDTRDVLIKELVRVKPLVFNQRASSWWAMSPFGLYVVAPTKTDNGDQWGIWHPETNVEDDPDEYAPDERAAMALAQEIYTARILSAITTTTAASVKAEALREAATIAVRIILEGKQARRDSIAFDVDEAIFALIDASEKTK